MPIIRRIVGDPGENKTPLDSLARTREGHLNEIRHLRKAIPAITPYNIRHLRSLGKVYKIDDKKLKAINDDNFGDILGQIEAIVIEKQEELAGIQKREEASKSLTSKPSAPIIETSEIPKELEV